MQKFAIGAFVVGLLGALASPAAAQSVTVSTVAELQAAVVAATGSTTPVDIRIKAGTYNLPSWLELSVATGATATLRNYGDGQVILARTEGSILRTGFATGRGSYVIKGLTLSGADTAVEHDGGDIRIEDSSFVDNLLGFYADASTANITILNSTFWENGLRCGEGSSYCGGIWLDFYRSATLANLTVAGAGNGVGIYGLGYASVGPTVLANSMILFNQWNCQGGAPGALGTNNIVDEPPLDCPGSTVVSPGFQVPGFGDHGGLVPTWPLTWDVTVPGPNPAIQGGDPAWCPSHDARGAIRRSPCDVGAYEANPRGFTLESASGAGEVTIETAAGAASFTNFHAIDPSRLPQTGLPPGVTFPFGLFEWTAVGLSLGQSLPVTITFPTDISSTSSLQYWKFDPASGQWADLCLQLACTQPSPNVLSFTITDGGVGDLDGVVNGSIRDPGGLGVGGAGAHPPDLALAKNFVSSGTSAATVGNGAVVTYRLTASNLGAGPTTGGITITDPLQPALTFLAAGSDPRCSAAVQAGVQIVTCIAAGPLASGGSETIDLAVQVSANAAPAGGFVEVNNAAVVSTNGDSDLSNNTSNTAVLTVNGPTTTNLTITKSLVGASTVNNGESVTYRLTVSNTGSGPTTGPLTVTDALDSRLGFVAAGSDSRCLAAGQLTQVVTCVASGVVAAGASDHFDVVVQVAANAAPIGGSVQIGNTATVSTADDSNPSDDTSIPTVLTVVGALPPNARLEKRFLVGANALIGPITVNQGATVTYQLRVINDGAGATTGPTVITDVLDPGLDFVTEGADSRCSAAGQTVTCVVAGVIAPNGGVESFNIPTYVGPNVIVPTSGPAQIFNRATVLTPNDSFAGDNDSNLISMVVLLGAATPVGTNVTVQPTDDLGMPQPIQLFFHNVISPGFTTAIPLPGGPALPPNFQLRGQMYDITTTAQYELTITVCFVGGPFLPSDRLLHYENGNWVELANQQLWPSGGPYTQLCAVTNSLSPFAVASVINTPPTLFLPTSITAEAASAAGASVMFTVGASDAEDGPLTASCTPGSGTLFPIGVTTVDCTATDALGAGASGAFTVTVADTTPPAIATPAPITQTATTSNGVAVGFTVTASDLVSGSLTPSCAPASGSVFAIGTTMVTCSAQDAAGNDATAAFTVTVLAPPNEHQAPTLTRITPDSGKRGTFQVVFLRGTGLHKKLSVRFSGEDIKVIEEVSLNATTAAALIFIKPNAVRGSRAVTVTNAFGTSNSLTFVVR